MEVVDADFDIKLVEGVVEGHLAMHFERWVEVVAEGQTTFDFEGK
jgi:hypothetical protein